MIYLMNRIWMTNCYIAHHGIKGQKWGKRNGPPYPLNSNARSSAEKKAAQNSSNETFRDNISRIGEGIMSYYKSLKVNLELKTNRNIDKETGLKLKNKQYTEDEDMAMVNPGYDNFNENTKNNCVFSTCTYEMRRRGYDVTANKSTKGYSDDDLKQWFSNAKTTYNKKEIDFYDGVAYLTKDGERRMKNALNGRNKEGANEALNMMKSQGSGARGNLMFNWNMDSGHSIAYEVKDGNVTLRDCQSNIKFDNPNYLLESAFNIRITRLDNLEINKKKIKEVCHS